MNEAAINNPSNTIAQLVAIYNEMAKQLDEPLVVRFASKAVGVKRTMKLLEIFQSKKPMATEAPKVTEAPKAKAKRAKAPKADAILEAGQEPTTRPGTISMAVYTIARELGPVSRADLTKHVLSEVKPPRSRKFDEQYVQGYISHAMKAGWLVAAE